jgi:Kef-type K+ transport system membrane component KefB
MTNYIILALCLLILLAYLFDITSRYSKIPGVILLIGLGIVIRLLVNNTSLTIPDIEPLLPVIGTVGLILIVMEASMDLRLGKDKVWIILKSVTAAVLLFALFVSITTLILYKLLDYPLITSILNSIPFGIISSAVAIPSAINLNREQKEFVIYESSFSDIVGILAFDFVLLNQGSFADGLVNYAFKAIITILLAILVTSTLAILMHKITYHVNYVIILTSVVLIYVLAKMVHLPALLLVLAFGIALANYKLVQNTLFRRYVDFTKFGNDLISFKKIMSELTFVVRSFFFIMFGFYTKIEGLLNFHNIVTALLIISGIYLLRIIFLRQFVKLPVFPYLFLSPRGLITILLFLSIPASMRIDPINEEVVTLVILISIVLMMIGNILYKEENIAAEESDIIIHEDSLPEQS